jgi:vancomycin resistance protein YoaR
MQAIRPKISRHKPEVVLEQITLTVFLALLLTISAAFLFTAGSQILFLGVIYPGVTVNELDVSKMTPDEASLAILGHTNFPQNGHILFIDGTRQWLASPAELGLMLDFDATANLAYQVGRTGNIGQRLLAQSSARSTGIDIQPVFIFDQDKAFQFLNSIAGEIYVPAVEPAIQISGTDVLVTQGQNGRQLDTAATLNLITIQLNSMQDGLIPLVVNEQTPIMVNPDQQAELARSIISKPLTLSLPKNNTDNGPWKIDRLTLAGMLSFEHVQSDNGQKTYQVTLDSQTLYNFLSNIETALYRNPINARFMFNDDTHQLEVLEPSVTGQSLDVQTSIQTIQDRLMQGEHDAVLELTYTHPPVTDKMTGADLGITELIHSETNFYYGSSSERIQNITAAAGRFHGLLIAPGETFSMATALGDISLENGYAEALIILGGQTIQGVGGGVCQVSTALFRTVFFSGFPVVERHSHAYRVSYYEKIAGNVRDSSLAGLDATVFVPLVDFKFTNDSPYWLLMETYINPSYSSLVWKFYSTSDGRSVEWQTSGVTNVVEAPDMLYRENPDFGQGEVKQVDWAADGADVTVQRQVYRDGQLINEDVFQTHYQPWQAVFEYGPGTEGMPPEENGKNGTE